MFNQTPAQKVEAENQRLIKKMLGAKSERLKALAKESASQGRAVVLKGVLAKCDYHEEVHVINGTAEALGEARDLECFQAILKYIKRDDLDKWAVWVSNLQWKDAEQVFIERVLGEGYLPPYIGAATIAIINDANIIEELYKKSAEAEGYMVAIDAIAQTGTANFLRFLELFKADNFSPNERAYAAVAFYKTGHTDSSVVHNLLDVQMNVNFENGAVMTAILRAGHLDLATRMIEQHQFETAFFQSDVYPTLLKESAPPEAIAFAKKYTAKTVTAADTDAGFQMIDDVSIARTQALPNNGLLTMIFNFGTAQQILITQLGEQVAPATVVNFAQIQNTGLLQAAAASFVARGGKVERVVESGLPAPIIKSRKDIAV